MAKIWFSLVDPEDIPTLKDVYNQLRLAMAEEIATSLKLKMEFSGKEDGVADYFVSCLDSEVGRVITGFIDRGVVPGTIDFTEPDTTIDTAVSLATIGFEYSLSVEEA